jgi:hypothetical protein
MQQSYDIASLNIQDVKVVVIFMDGAPIPSVYADLQRVAAQAGLKGNVVVVWPDEFGRTRFLAPAAQHAFFQVAGYDQLRAQINGSLPAPGALR